MPTIEEIMEAIAVLHRGEREAARGQLEALWARLSEEHAFDRAVVAHYLADAQDDPAQELWWDRRALESATSAASPDVECSIGGSVVTLASFLPSLHLNLAADHERLGELAEARVHARRAAEHVDQLDDAPLAAMTRGAIQRLLDRLG